MACGWRRFGEHKQAERSQSLRPFEAGLAPQRLDDLQPTDAKELPQGDSHTVACDRVHGAERVALSMELESGDSLGLGRGMGLAGWYWMGWHGCGLD
jgi:hypothetical protein